jgi:glycosyltransferase involved in cell wall biosynthesis
MDKQAFTIGFVLPIGLTLGGSNAWSVGMAAALPAAGYSCALLEHTCVDWHPPLDPGDLPSVPHIPCPGRTPSRARSRDIALYARAYRQLLPAVIIPNMFAATYAACAQLSLQAADSLRVIGVCHNDDDENYATICHYEPVLHKIIAVNVVMQEKLRAMLPHRADDIVLKPCPVMLPGSYEPRVRDKGDPIRITYAGRITNYVKKVSRLPLLIAQLASAGVDFTFRIIGEGGYKAWLTKEVNDLDESVSSRVRIEPMKGFNEMGDVWRDTDVVVLVSDAESTGLSMLEGMAYGCVPVSTGCNGPRDIIESGRNGFLVEHDAMGEMARQIALLAEDTQRFERMSVEARKTVRVRFSRDTYVPWFTDLCDSLWALPSRKWDPARPFFPRHLRPVQAGLANAFRSTLHSQWERVKLLRNRFAGRGEARR